MIPARVALALQADGWWLRSDIIWAKGVSFCPTYSGSVMPESVRDRPTQSYEHVFLLAKSRSYYYDAMAVRENVISEPHSPGNLTLTQPENKGARDPAYDPDRTWGSATGRNLRSVWTINPKPSRLAHYAAFPPALVEPMVLAGTSAKGCCPECGAGWVRVVEKGEPIKASWNTPGKGAFRGQRKAEEDLIGTRDANWHDPSYTRVKVTTGWLPGCDCGAELEPRPCVVLDCFGGTMTVGEVCAKHGRHFIGLDLKREYVEMGRERCADTQMAMAL